MAEVGELAIGDDVDWEDNDDLAVMQHDFGAGPFKVNALEPDGPRRVGLSRVHEGVIQVRISGNQWQDVGDDYPEGSCLFTHVMLKKV